MNPNGLTTNKVFWAVIAALVAFFCIVPMILFTFGGIMSRPWSPSAKQDAQQRMANSSRLYREARAELDAMHNAESIRIEFLQTWQVQSEISHFLRIHNGSEKPISKVEGFFSVTVEGKEYDLEDQLLYTGDPIPPGGTAQQVAKVTLTDNPKAASFPWSAVVVSAR